jgi:hypothetical protein
MQGIFCGINEKRSENFLKTAKNDYLCNNLTQSVIWVKKIKEKDAGSPFRFFDYQHVDAVVR